MQAEHGHRVHPCHHVTEDGGCSCRKCDPSQHGKHPSAHRWQRKASTKEATIRQWWTDEPECEHRDCDWPQLDLLIVDIDTRGKDGFQDLKETGPRRPRVRWHRDTQGADRLRRWAALLCLCRRLRAHRSVQASQERKSTFGASVEMPSPRQPNNLGPYEWVVSLDACEKAECPEWLPFPQRRRHRQRSRRRPSEG